jgi:nucleoid-associated protein YgaU
MLKLFLQIFLAAVLLAGLAGCGLKSKDEESHPLFKRAVKAQKAKETKLAIEYFQRYLVVNPESSKTHLMLASIYDETLDKPLQAVYHYERFLEFAPNSPEAENVKKWLDAAKKKYYFRARKEYNDPEDVANLQDTLYTTEQELKKHKQELAKAKILREKLIIYARQEHNNVKNLNSKLAELQAAHNKKLAEIAELKAQIAAKEKKEKEEKEKAEKEKAEKEKAEKEKAEKEKAEKEKAEKTEETAAEKTGKDEKTDDKKDLKPEEKKPENAEPTQDKAPEKVENTGKDEVKEKSPEKTEDAVKETEKPKEKTEEKTSPSPAPVTESQPKAPPFSLKKVEKTEAETSDKARTYVVQRGDSLSSISRRFYGSSRYYKIIFDANRDILSTERDLRPGQILKIPAR